MSKELLTVIEVVSNEKGLERETLFKAMEAALEMATRKYHDNEMDVKVTINQKTGHYDTIRRWTVVDEYDQVNPDAELTLEEAQAQDPSLKIGDVIEEVIPSIEFGRISAMAAKNVIFQKLREAEREQIVKGFVDKVGRLLTGQVKRVTRELIQVDLGDRAEGLLPRDQMIPREAVRVGDRVKVLLQDIRRDARGAQLMLSRTDPRMVKELFRQEVPEVAEDVIEIKAVARDPGVRSKIAVKTNDGRMDPVGACVGVRGARVQAVSTALNGERIDIILWDDNPAQLAINAMAPAEVVSIVVDEESHTMDIAVPDDLLSAAIGKSGQNVSLAGQLTGWRLNVVGASAASQKQQAENQKTAELFMHAMEVDEELALLLVAEGFSSLEEVAYVDRQELLKIEEFDTDLVDELQERARNALLAKALGGAQPTQELLDMEGMTPEIAHALAARSITTVEELADQSLDDILDIPGMTHALGSQLILKAREPWFLGE